MFETSSAHTLTPITFFNRSGQGLAWSWRDLARSRPSSGGLRKPTLTSMDPEGLYRQASPALGRAGERGDGVKRSEVESKVDTPNGFV